MTRLKKSICLHHSMLHVELGRYVVFNSRFHHPFEGSIFPISYSLVSTSRTCTVVVLSQETPSAKNSHLKSNATQTNPLSSSPHKTLTFSQRPTQATTTPSLPFTTKARAKPPGVAEELKSSSAASAMPKRCRKENWIERHMNAGMGMVRHS